MTLKAPHNIERYMNVILVVEYIYLSLSIMKARKAMARNKKSPPLKNIAFMLLLGAYVATVIREQLNRPPEERTWQGKLLGIPYDFRPPTVERLRNAFWNKNTAQVLVPQPLGIGWTLNLYPLVHPEPPQVLEAERVS